MSWSLKSHTELKTDTRAANIGVFAITPIFSADLAKLYLCFPPLIPYLRGQYFSAHRLVYVRVATAESNGHPDSRREETICIAGSSESLFYFLSNFSREKTKGCVDKGL